MKTHGKFQFYVIDIIYIPDNVYKAIIKSINVENKHIYIYYLSESVGSQCNLDSHLFS